MRTNRWNGKVNVNSPEFKSEALPWMSDRQLSFFAQALKATAPDAHKAVLEEIERRCVLAYVEEGLGG